MNDFTDDRVVHVCACGWRGRWDEAFAHIAGRSIDDRDHRIIDDYLPRRFDVLDPVGDGQDDRGDK